MRFEQQFNTFLPLSSTLLVVYITLPLIFASGGFQQLSGDILGAVRATFSGKTLTIATVLQVWF